MRNIILFFTLFLSTIVTFAVENVDPVSVTISGVSNKQRDGATGAISEAYAGIAGTCPAAEMNNISTCNSCSQPGALAPCNMNSVYPNLPISVSFTVKTAIDTPATGTVNAQVLIMLSTSPTLTGTVAITKTLNLPVAAGTVVQFDTTTKWSEVCALAGFTTSCTPTGTTSNLANLIIAFGIDTNNSGTVELDEVRKIPLKLQLLPATSTYRAQTFCGTTATSGVCNILLKAGDSKAVINSFPVAIGAEPDGLTWDAVVFFPVPVAQDRSQDAAAFSGFTTQSKTPNVHSMTISGASANVADSAITGNIENYQRYCFVYGTKNRAQNIFKFMTDPLAAPNACVTPSEIVGMLEDKHCFISTAAFGSDMAPEVQTFREFRNKYLLTNSVGKVFVKLYYKMSPPIANIISESEILRTITRSALYPVLAFIQLSLHYGLALALLVLAVLLILAVNIREMVRHKKTFLIVLILLATPFLKADPKPATKKALHPAARAEGLIRISKDGTYIYDLKQPLKKQSGHIRVGQAEAPDISIAITPKNGGATKTYKFDQFYESSSNLLIGYDYEWFPWIAKGKTGVQAGVSFMMAQGHGRLAADPDIPSEESFSFFTVPLTLGGVYRFEYKDKQIVAPYVTGGATYLLLAEKREDQSKVHFAGGFGGYGAAGLLFNLSFLDDDSGYTLDSQYGISNLWLSLEYKAIEVQASAFNFSTQYLNAGLSFDF
ncbi:MAG: hypothetical protein H7061_06800 [Bdellovibrionaceae bacterium]|nr:hypothetical protein [Bdellovibrio sp.]